MTTQRSRTTSRGATSPVTLILLGGILLALVGIIVLLAMNQATGAGGQASGSKAPPMREVGAGQTVTRQDVESQGRKPTIPSQAVDNQRIAQTYKKGHTYRSLLKIAVNTRASHKDWGIAQDATMVYAGEAEIFRTIESNDGKTLVILQEFRKSRTLTVFTKIEGIRLSLGPLGQTLLDMGGILLSKGSLPPGWSEVAVGTINQYANNDLVKDILSRVATDSTAKAFAYVDALQGKKARITYVNGQGVTSITPVDCTLTSDDQMAIMNTSFVSDAYILPDPTCKPGDTWTIHGEDMLPIVDPSMRVSMGGAVTARRGADEGTAENRLARISLERGMLDLQDADGHKETRARWAPRGDMVFSFQDGIVTAAELTGALSIEQHSTDHILFEARYSARPEYQLSYYCEVVR